MVDAARLADELRCEQDIAMNLEKDKKLLEAQCKDAAARADEAEVNALKGGRKAMIKKLLEAQCKDAAQRADEAEVNALKGGRKAMIKMETRTRELESELDAESRRFSDVNKNLRKSER